MSVCETRKLFAESTLIQNRTVNGEIFELSFAWTGRPPEPGQFFLIKPAYSSVFLGRAISVFSWEGSGQSPAGVLRFLIALRGEGTKQLSSLQAGDLAFLCGPLGNTWKGAAAALPSLSPSGGKPLALIGGGIGVAPLAALARTLPEGSYDFLAGFRSRSFGLQGLEPRDLMIATEDGCEGCEGRIPDQLVPERYSAVYCCGPEPMLKAVQKKCAEAGTPCLLSLEKRMACGVGACLGCTIHTTAGNRRCCADGPIFNASEILFDE